MDREVELGIEHMKKTDHYWLKKFKPGFFSFIMDLGAYGGYFSLFARELHPDSKIVAVEGVAEPTFRRLVKNTYGANIICAGEVMGNGGFLNLYHGRGDPHLFRWSVAGGVDLVSNKKADISVKTKTFSQLFKEHYSGGPYFLKFNVEGAERFLIGDVISEDLLQGADGIGMQVHFPTDKHPWPDWLSFEEYDMWVKDTFLRTHYVAYHDSRKKIGYGHYSMFKKGTKGLLDDPVCA